MHATGIAEFVMLRKGRNIMATLQGLTICPAIHSRQAGTYIMVVNEPVRKTTTLKSRFLGCNSIRGWKATENSRFCVKRRMAIQCTFSSSSNDNGSRAENYSENDEDYVNSSVLEAVEVKSGSEGFTIKMRDGNLLKCTHNNPQSGHLPDYASHPAIVLKMEDETGLLLPIIARPTMYHVIKEMVEKMGYAVKLVRVTQRVHEAYFAQIYLTKIDNEEECITLDLRPSDAINIAVRCQVPIQVNKHLAYSDGMRVVEAAKLPAYGPGSDGFLLTEMDRASGQTSVETEEFNLLRNMVEAATEERYQDAGMNLHGSGLKGTGHDRYIE
ncbi:hypothetical protein V2J09_017123 [Rumex salicifolius]